MIKMLPLPDLFSNIEPDRVIFWFLVGVFAASGWQKLKCNYKNWRDPTVVHKPKKVNWLFVAIAISLLVSITIGIQNQQTYNFATKLAEDTRACQVQFNEALKIRGAITAENDKWSQIQRKALADWIHDLIFPPPNIAVLQQGDPVRQEWVLARTSEADRVIREAQLEQDQNIRARPEYPDPTCGGDK